MADVQHDINNLLLAVKSLRAAGLKSVAESLKQSELDRSQLKERLQALLDQEASLTKPTDQAERFSQAWKSVTDLFRLAKPEQQRELVARFIDSMEWFPADAKGRTGTYKITFFPPSRLRGADEGAGSKRRRSRWSRRRP
jgi:hypothetical protein